MTLGCRGENSCPRSAGLEMGAHVTLAGDHTFQLGDTPVLAPSTLGSGKWSCQGWQSVRRGHCAAAGTGPTRGPRQLSPSLLPVFLRPHMAAPSASSEGWHGFPPRYAEGGGEEAADPPRNKQPPITPFSVIFFAGEAWVSLVLPKHVQEESYRAPLNHSRARKVSQHLVPTLVGGVVEEEQCHIPPSYRDGIKF